MNKKEIKGFEEPVLENISWQEAIKESWMHYFIETLGLPEALALDRVEIELEGSSAFKTCESLKVNGFSFNDKKVLDIGCGHGTMVIEMAKRGAFVTGLEPSDAWRKVALDRVESLSCKNRIKILSGIGESLPFENEEFDFIVSQQVLEHVKDPAKMIKEISRVLKKKGVAYISCENYLSFFEAHYKVKWFPLLPKGIGSIYLKMIGRNPEFLKNNVTYTIYPKLIWDFLCAGLWSQSWPIKFQKYPFILKFFRILIKQRTDIFKYGFLHFFVHME